ncbi:hypothetical protein DQ04_05281010 [Trypanosoma grayi]|uniref:hypothetical protein n=1 Tax=Trypanosoma grayi TaxID=71804 RepID=UPI0004F470B6|nr:hypothetical protein DQ04_05281010 [Trypanosoma grayi]KEG09399.1 hypothetical protein DQ04_05281010 [Trypanosoma grayi]
MAFFDLVDMTVAYGQYLYILLSISPMSFPDFYVEPFRSLQYATLDFINSFSEGSRYNNPLEITLPNWLPLDFRLQFAAIVIIAPLLVALLGILIVCATGALLWILLTLTALFAMIFGAVLLANPWVYSTEGIPTKTRVLLVSIGSVSSAVLICAGIVVTYLWRARLRKKEDAIMANSSSEMEAHQRTVSLAEKAVTRTVMNRRALAAHYAYEDKKNRYMSRRRLHILFPQTVMGVGSVFAGLIISGLLPVNTIRFLQVSHLGRGAGGFLLAVGILTLVWVALGAFKNGRRLQVKIDGLLSGPALDLMMIAISLIYSPVLLNILHVLWCVDVTCDAGERMANPGSMTHTERKPSVLDPPVNLCYPCNFSVYSQRCPASLQTDLCGSPVRERRLDFDQTVMCSQIDVFYWVAVAVILFAYTVSYPVFLVVAADRATRILEAEYPLEKRICDEFTEKELYYEKVRKSANVSAPIYQVYKRRYRKARLTFLLQRILLVTISCLTRRGHESTLPWLGLALVLIVSVLYFAYTVLLRPYARSVENVYGATHQFIIAAVASVGIVGSTRGKDAVPFGLAVFIAVLVFLAPLLALIIGFVDTFREDRHRAERLQQRLLRGFAVKRDSNAPGGLDVRNGEDSNDNGISGDAAEDEAVQGVVSEVRKPSGDVCSHKSNDNNRNNNAGSVPLALVGETPEVPTSSHITQHQQGCCVPCLPQFEGGGGGDGRKDASCSVSLSPRDRRLLVATPSEPTTEREPLDLLAQVEGRRESFLLSGAARGTSGSHEKDPRIDEETSDDDYFNDKRLFVPSMYFSEYDGIPLGSASEEAEGEGQQQQEEEQLQQQQDEEEQQQQQQQQHDDHNNDEDSRKNATKGKRRGKLFQWLRRWQEVLQIGDTPLRYEDVLKRRKELHKSTGFSERPFWLKASETQLQTYNVEGGTIPWFCASINRARTSEITAAGRRTIFPQLRERKNQRYSPMVVPCRLSVATDAGDNRVPMLTLFRGGIQSNACIPGNMAMDASVISSISNKNNNVHGHATGASGRSQNSDIQHQAAATASGSQFIPPAVRHACSLNAQWKIEKMRRHFPRDIKSTYNNDRRSTIFAPVIPKVHMEGVEVMNWDLFLEKLLSEVSDPLQSAMGGETSASTREGVAAPAEECVGGAGDMNRTAQPVDGASAPADQLPQLRRHYILRQRLRAAFQQHSERLRTLQQAVDHRIAITIKKYMQMFFVGLSFFTVVALVMCLCGMLHTESFDFVDGVRHESTVEHELLGFGSWEEFTSHCCCLSVLNLTATFPYYVLDVEDWLCDNGRVKERVRRDAYQSVVVSGYAVRDKCGMEFRNGCTLTVDDSNHVELIGCSSEVTELEKVRW